MALTLVEINDLRVRVIDNEEVSDEELAAAVDSLREERKMAKPQQKGKTKPSVGLMDLVIEGEDA